MAFDTDHADFSSYLDRNNVSNARLAGLKEDLHMSDTVWNAGISTFYVGHLIGQLPGNLWLTKARPASYCRRSCSHGARQRFTCQG